MPIQSDKLSRQYILLLDEEKQALSKQRPTW
jgi:hypothetical protein